MCAVPLIRWKRADSYWVLTYWLWHIYCLFTLHIYKHKWFTRRPQLNKTFPIWKSEYYKQSEALIQWGQAEDAYSSSSYSSGRGSRDGRKRVLEYTKAGNNGRHRKGMRRGAEIARMRAVPKALPASLFPDKALHVTQGLAEIWRVRLLQPLWPHLLWGPHPDSFLVKLASNHPSPCSSWPLVKLSVTQDTNRLRVSDNMVIWWGGDSWSTAIPFIIPISQPYTSLKY